MHYLFTKALYLFHYIQRNYAHLYTHYEKIKLFKNFVTLFIRLEKNEMRHISCIHLSTMFLNIPSAEHWVIEIINNSNINKLLRSFLIPNIQGKNNQLCKCKCLEMTAEYMRDDQKVICLFFFSANIKDKH